MSKVLAVVATVASIAAVIPGPHQPIARAVATVAAVGSALTAKQGKPPNQGSITDVRIGANLPTPYCMGRTYAAGALMHDAGYGPTTKKVPNPYRSRVHVWSLGPVQEIEAFQADFQTVTFTGGNANGYYHDFLYLSTQRGLTPEAAALTGPWGAIPNWGASSKLSGLAAGLASLKFDKDGTVYQSGVPQFGAILKAVLAYDPRKDSTYPGGSGAHRWDNEATWEWTENPALHAIAYARGRYQNGKKVFGCGFPRESIILADYVAWANVCDANNWKIGGTIWEPGSRWDNLKRICEAGGARPVFDGARLSVSFYAPKVSLDTISWNDLAPGEIDIPAMRSWRERKNSLIPKYRSEAHKWEYVQAAAVSTETYVAEDGEDKEEEVQFDLVQDATQAAQLVAYDLADRREFGPVVLPLKPRFWNYGIGDALTGGPDLDELGLAGQLLEIVGRERDLATGVVTLTFHSETTAKHPFALGQTGVAPPTPSLTSGQSLDSVAFGAAPRNTIYRQVSDPAAANVILDYDMWVELTSPQRVWVRIGGTWQTAANYITSGSDIGVANGATKNTIYRQGTAPASPIDGDLWADTSATPNVIKVRVAGAWQVAGNLVTQGTDIGVANGATKNILYRQATAPTSPVDGDVWVDTSLTPTVTKIRVGGAWQNAANLVTQGADIGVANGATKNTIYRQTAAPTTPIDGDVWVDTGVTPNTTKVRVSGAWQSAANLVTQGTDIGVANGATKNTFYRQVSAPASPIDGDFWVELVTPMKAWVRIGGSWQTAANYITQGSDIGVANGATKNVIYRQATAPASPADGDFWVDTSATPNLTKTYISGAWQAAANLVTQGTDIGVENGATKNTLFRQTTAPAGATDGAFWVDTSLTPNVLKQRIAGVWQNAANLVTQGADIGVANAATRNTIYRQGTAPASPIDGDLWADTSTTPNVIRVRVSGAWQLAGNLVTQGTDIGVANGATADLTFTTVGAITVAGNRIVGAADNSWAGATSVQSFTGSAVATARRFHYTNGYSLFGLTETTGITSSGTSGTPYNQIVAGFYFYEGSIFCWYGTGSIATATAAATDALNCQISYDGVRFTWKVALADGTFFTTSVTTTRGRTFKVGVATLYTDRGVQGLTFGPFTANDFLSIGGDGTPAPNAGSTLTPPVFLGAATSAQLLGNSIDQTIYDGWNVYYFRDRQKNSAYLRCRCTGTGYYAFAGLSADTAYPTINSDPNGYNYTHGLYFQTGSMWLHVYNVGFVNTGRAVNPNAVYSIQIDNNMARFFEDNIELGAAGGYPVYFRDASWFVRGQMLGPIKVYDIQFGQGTDNYLDNMADGGTYARLPVANSTGTGPARRAIIDLNHGHVNKTLDYLGDGASYARPLASRVNAGRPTIDFSEAIHGNKTLDYVGDGGTYARPLASRVNVGRPLIDFSEAIHSNKTQDYIADGGTYGRILGSQLQAGAHKLTVAGSNVHVGDQRNLLPIGTMNLGYKWPSAPTYTADAAGNATITLPAATVPLGSVSVSYSLRTVSVTGTPGTIVSYQLYFDDLNFAGGSPTLFATTNGTTVYQADGRVWPGAISVSYPTTGTTGGTGGGGGGGGRSDGGPLP